MTCNLVRKTLLPINVRRVLPTVARGMSKLAEFASLQDGHGSRVQIDYQSDVAIIVIDRGENRMNDEFIDQINAAMDEALRFIICFNVLWVRVCVVCVNSCRVSLTSINQSEFLKLPN